MKNPQVSIIIPVYNTGDYLRACVDSITAQTYRNLEIIIVDDGSESFTAELCDELAANDSRIKVIHKKNEGVSIARNTGLDAASGEFLGFIDSDDTIEPQMFERMLEAIHQSGAQIAMCDAVTVYSNRPDEPDTLPDYTESTLIDTKKLAPSVLTNLAGSVCRCIYRRTDALLKFRVRFPEGIKFSEDRIFNIAAMGLADKIAYIKEPFYRRLIRPGSACFRFYPDMTRQIASMRRTLLDTVTRFWGENYVEAYEHQIAAQIRFAVTNFTATSNALSASAQKKLLKELCGNNDITECLRNSNPTDMRSRLILSNRCTALFCIGRLTNFIHRLCRKGQYRP